MQSKTFEQFNVLGENALETARQVGAINLRTADQLTRTQLDVFELCLEGGSKQLKLLQESKGYSDLLGAQAKLAEEYSRKFMDAAQQSMNVLTGARDELYTVFESRFEKAREQGAELVEVAKKEATSATKSAKDNKAA